MFFKIGVLKNFAIFTEKHLCWSLFLRKLLVWRHVTLLKRDSNTGDFAWILQSFWTFFYRTPQVAAFEIGQIMCSLILNSEIYDSSDEWISENTYIKICLHYYLYYSLYGQRKYVGQIPNSFRSLENSLSGMNVNFFEWVTKNYTTNTEYNTLLHQLIYKLDRSLAIINSRCGFIYLFIYNFI